MPDPLIAKLLTQTGRGLAVSPSDTPLPDDAVALLKRLARTQEDILRVLLAMEGHERKLARWFFGSYVLEDQDDTTVRVVPNGGELEFGVATDLEFGGALIFASIAMSSKDADLFAIIDGQTHAFPADSLVDGGFDIPIAPSIVVMRVSNDAPEFSFAVNFGAPEGFAVQHTIRMLARNRSGGNLLIYDTVARFKRFTE